MGVMAGGMAGVMRPALVLCLGLVAVPVAAQTTPGGLGYGRHALMPPRHDLRPPPLLPDGSRVPVPEIDLGDVPRDRSLPRGPQSTAARHANWCRTRYRSYDARTDTFALRAGVRVRCASPFRR